MPGPIGVTFMPNAENQQNGPRQGGLEGPGSTDLAQAFKVLSLRLPQVLGAQSLSPRKLLEGGGAAAVPGGINPGAAIFQAMLTAMNGGQPFSPTPEAPAGRFGPAMPPEPRYNPQPPPAGGGYVPPPYRPSAPYEPPPLPDPGPRVVYEPPDTERYRVPDAAPDPVQEPEPTSYGRPPQREPRQRWV